MFVDEVEIQVAAGHGGRGAMSFRREKFIPRGGPDGGDGGNGGSVYLVASPHVNTLVNYRFHPTHEAKRGGHGSGANRTGAAGADIELDVPIGTLVYAKRVIDEGDGGEGGEGTPDDFEIVADLSEAGQRTLIARGGKGGLGNAHFATSTNRAPRKWQPGLPGEAFTLRLHLKLLADVGLVGYPNAGKSTLISRISAAKPKIADYPFTTLTPNLGVVTLSDERSFVVADVPGLIEGAHDGHGLGDKFLKHLDRTKVLIFMVDVSGMSGRDPVADLDVLRRELALFSRDLASKPQLVAATKMDAVTDDAGQVGTLEARARELGVPFFRISSAAGTGLDALVEAAWSHISAARVIAATEPRTLNLEPGTLNPEP
jgi:GTPase